MDTTADYNTISSGRIPLFQTYMDWESAADTNYKEKIEKKENQFKECISSDNTSLCNSRGPYNTPRWY